MPSTIDAAFNAFLGQLRATPAESAAAASHRASIEAKLEATFGITSFFRTGSFGAGTNIVTYSDVDYFAVIPTSKLKSRSDLTLAEVAEALRERFPTTAGIRVDSPGVRVPFGLEGAHAAEIVPVDEMTWRTKLGFRAFDIPDGNGGWMFSAPDSHGAYVGDIDARLDYRVKPLIRFVKAWKFMRNVPIRSFYLEIRTAKYAGAEKSIIYDIDLLRVFREMLAEGLQDLPDPRFPDDPYVVKACRTELHRAEALSKLARTAEWAAEAWEHKQAGRIRQAFERWSLVFDGAFPPFTIA
ncbi:MAG: nucleotidyltransferase [Hyphomicrobium sp.]|jgi:hypothetical protein